MIWLKALRAAGYWFSIYCRERSTHENQSKTYRRQQVRLLAESGPYYLRRLSPIRVISGRPRRRLAPGSVTALVDRLERRGWVLRHRGYKDRRKTHVAVTNMMKSMARETYVPVADWCEKRLYAHRAMSFYTIKHSNRTPPRGGRPCGAISRNVRVHPSLLLSKEDPCEHVWFGRYIGLAHRSQWPPLMALSGLSRAGRLRSGSDPRRTKLSVEMSSACRSRADLHVMEAQVHDRQRVTEIPAPFVCS